jgi:hypothetical protein
MDDQFVHKINTMDLILEFRDQSNKDDRLTLVSNVHKLHGWLMAELH